MEEFHKLVSACGRYVQILPISVNIIEQELGW